MPKKPIGKRAGRGPYIAPPVQRAVRLLRHIAEGNPILNMSDTAKVLKINRTTLLRLLYTLEVEGFIERRPSGAGYQPGLAFLGVAARTLFSQELVQTAMPVLTRLAESVQLSAHLGVLDGTDVLYLVRRTPNTPLASNIRIGSRLPAHATTMGRILLAFMTPTEIDALFAGKKLERFSDFTATTLRQLHQTAVQDREAKIAWSEGYFERDIASAAVPVFDFAGAVVGAVNVSGPLRAFGDKKRRQAIGDQLMKAGEEISQRLGWIARSAPSKKSTRALVGTE
jgi:DNA-binding IclR family transcriptional regulator